MAFDQTKPATTDNYSTQFTQGVQANFLALAMWLDSTNATITGAIPTFTKRYNRTSGMIEEYSGTSWGVLAHNIPGNAATATAVTNVSGGVAGAIPYQTGVGATGFSAAGTAGMTLISGGAGVPTWTTSPTFTAPALGTPASGNLASCTFPTLNQSTTGNAATATTATTAASCSGNAATATHLANQRAAWASGGNLVDVAGQIGWKNYGNNHTIFDASAGTDPNGGAVNNTNAGTAWSPTYPTLMGFNGSTTYGVRVDVARYSESCTGNAATASNGGVTSVNGVTGAVTAAKADGGFAFGAAIYAWSVVGTSGNVAVNCFANYGPGIYLATRSGGLDIVFITDGRGRSVDASMLSGVSLTTDTSGYGTGLVVTSGYGVVFGDVVSSMAVNGKSATTRFLNIYRLSKS